MFRTTSLCFKICLKSFVVSQALSSGFKEFQIVAILNLKDRCPVAVLCKGVSIMLEFLVTREEMSHRLTNCSVRYAGAFPVMHLNAMTASRKYKYCRTGGHFSSCRIGVT